MLRKAGQYPQEYFDEIRAKLLRIAEIHEVVPLCKWWTYDELIQHDKFNYYEHYRGTSLYDVASDEQVLSNFLSEAKKKRVAFSPLLAMVAFTLSMGLSTYCSVEIAQWCADGGRQKLVSQLARLIRQYYETAQNGVGEAFTDHIQFPFLLDGVPGVARELHIPEFVAALLIKCTSLQEPEFKSESFSAPVSKPDTLIARVITFVMEWLLALFPFVNTGRYAEIGLTSLGFSRLLTLVTCSQYLIDNDSISLFDRSSLYRVGFQIKQLIVKQWLRDGNDLIRKQAFCVLLEGQAGAGKTTCAIAIAKKLIPDIKRRDIIVLNEDDDFQSELRTNHRVIILDDVVNTARNWLTESPLRRVIDTVNNTPRRALSPDVELKGNIKINPELVILTTNVYFSVLLSFTECQESLVRRWHRFVIKKVRKFSEGFDVGAWAFDSFHANMHERSIEQNGYNRFHGYSLLRENLTFDQFSNGLKADYHIFNKEQEVLVEMVNNHIDEDTVLQRVYRKLLKGTPKYKSESLNWDNEVCLRLSKEDLTPENFLHHFTNVQDQLLRDYSIDEFDAVPINLQPEAPRQTWWQWLRTQLHLDTFRSEGFSDYFLGSPKHVQKLGPEAYPIELSDKQQVGLIRARGKFEMESSRYVVVEDDYVIFLTPHGRVDTVQFTSSTGIQKFAGQQYLLNERYADRLDLHSSPNCMAPYDVVAFYAWYDEMRGFRSEGLSSEKSKVPHIPCKAKDSIDFFVSVFGEQSVGDFLESHLLEVAQFVYKRKHACSQPVRKITFSDSSMSTRSGESVIKGCHVPDDAYGFASKELIEVLSESELTCSLGIVPSEREYMAQQKFIERFKKLKHVLVGREVNIIIDNHTYSCDLIFKKNDVFTFVEVKQAQFELSKKQAILRKEGLTPHLTFDHVHFGHYSAHDDQFELV